MRADGAFSVKSYNYLRRDVRQMVIKAARETRMMVVPEGGSTFFYNMNMILDGHTGIEHAVPVAPFYKDVVTLFAAAARRNTHAHRRLRRHLGREILVSATKVWENEKLYASSRAKT